MDILTHAISNHTAGINIITLCQSPIAILVALMALYLIFAVFLPIWKGSYK